MNDPTAINVLSTTAFLAVLVMLIVERVKKHWPNLDGDLIVGASWVLGTLAAWTWNLQGSAAMGYPGLPLVLDYVATGLGIAGVAGFAGTLKNVLRAKDPTSTIHSEGVTISHLRPTR